MEPSLFSFIWAHSKRQQLGLLVLTLCSFPFLYASLELPKIIINDAIGSDRSQVDLWGYTFTRVEYLLILCLAFLGTVLIGGLLKMRLNISKGVLAERMLRRLRYVLIERMMRFPTPYFRTTSQGELVSMITSESEPMGGLMGDAVAQPVFLTGQMITIVAFLFMQSLWFGLAAVALIPLQAWLIPMLQRQINLLNKDRIQEVRRFASEIGETAAGISDLRANGGGRFRLALVSDRLGRLFEIRRRIYLKKFFMKFLNNLIGQITPFFFYLIGGILALRGEITVGALVAALAAHKDLSGPWKELLTYYNQVQDMGLRWKIVTDRFAPKGMLDAALVDGEPKDVPHLFGDIVLQDVSVRDANGNMVLEEVNLTIPAGARVAVKGSTDAERTALAQLLTREVLPSSGSVTLAGHRLDQLHQSVIAARVGHAYSRPYLFEGTLGENVLMPLRGRPHLPDGPGAHIRRMIEAQRAGNSVDPIDTEWSNVQIAAPGGQEDIRDWWFQLIEAMGVDEQLFRRTLHTRIGEHQNTALVADILRLRPLIAERLRQAGLDKLVFRFDPEAFNPAVPLGGNLLFAAPTRDIRPEEIAADGPFRRMMEEQGLAEESTAIGLGVVETLMATFGRDNTTHPLFVKLGLDPEMYGRLCAIAERQPSGGNGGLSAEDRGILMTVPFMLTAEQIGPGFPEEYKHRILEIRKTRAAALLQQSQGMFRAIGPDVHLPRLTVLENALYGKISQKAGAKTDQIEDLVAQVLTEQGLRKRLTFILYDLSTGLGGANLPSVIQERAAFTRAAIKRPDVLVLDQALASHDADSRLKTRERLRDLMPKTTMIFLEDKFEHPERYDLFVEIRNGRIDGVQPRTQEAQPEAATADFRRKLSIIAATDLFAKLDARNQRLLAFSAQWHRVETGQPVFRHAEKADAVYLCLSGQAELRMPDSQPGDTPISTIEPGRLIGDLSVIVKGARQMDLVATHPSAFLRIGAEEYRSVIESDAGVAVQLLETVAGHLSEVAEIFRSGGVNFAEVVQARNAALQQVSSDAS